LKESTRSFTVSSIEDGLRLDRFLSSRVEEIGRKLASAICEAGRVRVEGHRQKKSFVLRESMTVELTESAFGRALVAPEVQLDLALITDRIVVAEKAAGVACGALPGREEGTLAGALLSRFPEMGEVGFAPREPGLIHRLDTDTSGLILAARNQETFRFLRDALIEGLLKKRYLAVVPTGALPSSGSIDLPLENDPQDRRRVRIAKSGTGRAAVSHFRVVEEKNGRAVVEVTANRAFRHQVRVHLAHLGAPLVGDRLYGGASALTTRHALHASYIAWDGSGFPAFSIESALPEDLRALLVGAASETEL
jgi:23S rRNA pseudouridine1911/1915/1917 synthase